MQVKTKIQETVYPSAPSPAGARRVLELSNNDQIMPRLYTSMLIFFNEGPSEEEVSVALKGALAEVLSLFYPCAGRYKEREDGGLEIECNDEGASFHEVWVDASFDSFGPDFQPHPDFALLVPKVDSTAAISEIPLLLAQVTHFQCGGLCLGIQLHHNVCDGLSTAHFLSSWAEIAKAKAHANDQVAVALPPHIERSPLKANEPPFPSSEHPEYQTHMPALPATWPHMSSKIFPFTPASIDALKAKASSNLTPSHSGFEALAAHLWRCVTQARGLAASQVVRLGMAVDGRRRFNPPLPEGYFGNVNFYGYAIAKAGELVENPLSYAADLVKNAIAEVCDAHMRSALDWIEKQESPKSIIASFCTPFNDLAITSWSRFPLYELDFGWGKPSFVRIPTSAFDGLAILLPSLLGPGHIDALVGFQMEHMHKFECYLNDL